MKQHEIPTSFSLSRELERIALLLPVQGPIKDFIHQNILLNFVNENFDDAVKHASGLYEARAFMDFSYYRSKFQERVISEKCLNDTLDILLPLELSHERMIFYDALFTYHAISDEKTLYFVAHHAHISKTKVEDALKLISSLKKNYSNNPKILRPMILEQTGIDFDHEVHQLLIRLLGSFVDQGVSLWPYFNQGKNFIEAVADLARASTLPLKPWIHNKELVSWLTMPHEQAIYSLLGHFLESESLFAPYIQETLLAHPGWSGMVQIISKNPQALSKSCSIDLSQLLLVKLALESQFIKSRCENFIPLNQLDYINRKSYPHRFDKTDILSVTLLYLQAKFPPSEQSLKYLGEYFLKKVWQRALESTYYQKVHHLLVEKKPKTSNKPKYFQAVFCIDDRECSFRRILEQQSDTIETFSTPGFFGIDCYFVNDLSLPQKICPPPVTARHLIKQTSHHLEKNDSSSMVELASFMARHGANSTILGFLSACTIGHVSLFRLISSFFHPIKWKEAYDSNKKTTEPCPIYERTSDQIQPDGLWHGYSVQEMAERVYNTLRNMGLYDDFAPFVIMFGHGSSSMNNPHFASYDCGACSGRPGNINARIFALLANRCDVRALVKEKGITIPQSTHFIGAYHDTCNDCVEYFDLEVLNQQQQEQFTSFSHHVLNTAKKNAKERCEKFALVAKNISEDHALKEVFHRSRALFEPRPELGHTNNALMVIGRRSRTYKIDLERRALLQSYDPTIDPDGTILNAILSATIPVSAGINLDYYFSRLDPAIYGCGSKLSHNVMSLIGVGNGLDDDLRTGLPIQMTELHDPIRLLMVIEQYESIIETTIYNNKELKPVVENCWIKLASLHPEKNSLTIFDPATSCWKEFNSRGIL